MWKSRCSAYSVGRSGEPRLTYIARRVFKHRLIVTFLAIVTIDLFETIGQWRSGIEHHDEWTVGTVYASGRDGYC